MQKRLEVAFPSSLSPERYTCVGCTHTLLAYIPIRLFFSTLSIGITKKDLKLKHKT